MLQPLFELRLEVAGSANSLGNLKAWLEDTLTPTVILAVEEIPAEKLSRSVGVDGMRLIMVSLLSSLEAGSAPEFVGAPTFPVDIAKLLYKWQKFLDADLYQKAWMDLFEISVSGVITIDNVCAVMQRFYVSGDLPLDLDGLSLVEIVKFLGCDSLSWKQLDEVFTYIVSLSDVSVGCDYVDFVQVADEKCFISLCEDVALRSVSPECLEWLQYAQLPRMVATTNDADLANCILKLYAQCVDATVTTFVEVASVLAVSFAEFASDPVVRFLEVYPELCSLFSGCGEYLDLISSELVGSGGASVFLRSAGSLVANGVPVWDALKLFQQLQLA